MPKYLSKAGRVLELYQQLILGQTVQKSDAAVRYGVDERSIQRDIDDIRAFLDEQATVTGERITVAYDRQKKGFVLEGRQSPLMTNSEILAVSKILLESRAFSKEDMSVILDKLVSGCVPQENMKLVSDLLSNEKFHYVEITDPKGLQDKLWNIGLGVRRRNLIELSYRRQGEESAVMLRVVEPVSILFSEYYFYLNAYVVEPDDGGHYVHKHDYPTVFRIDRIESYRILKQKFHLPYTNRFQEGEFRKRVQFMYPGKLQVVRFRYTGASVDAVLDRLPTAKILRRDQDGYVLEAEVYGKGILMWLLSQGDRIEVLSPQQLRQEVKGALESTLALY